MKSLKTYSTKKYFGTFLKIVKSKPDGHCIIHSTTHCFVHRYPNRYHEVYIDLLRHIRTECSRNRMVYAPILKHGVANSLDDECENYMVYKIFDTLFGGMILNIVANILHRYIFIVEKHESSEYCVTIICPRENNTPIYCTSRAGESPLILLKTGLHVCLHVHAPFYHSVKHLISSINPRIWNVLMESILV